MAKFCMNCGQPLVDGQPCSCTTTQNVVTPEATQQTINVQPSNNGTVNAQPVNNGTVNTQQVVNQQPVQNTANNVNMEKTKNFLAELIGLIVNVLKQPYTTAVEYVRSNDVLSAIILFVIQGLFTGILISTGIKRAISEATNGFGSAVEKVIDINVAGTIIVALLVSVALSFAYAAVLWLVVVVFKVQTNYLQCVRIMAVRSVAMIAGTIFAIVITLLSSGVGVVIAAIVVPCVGFLYTVAALKTICTVDENKLVSLLMVFIVISLLVYYIIALKIGFTNIPLVKNIKNGLGDVASLLGGVGDLSSLFN